MSAAGFEIVYRSTACDFSLNPPDPKRTVSPAHWHHDSYHTTRQKAEARASELILSGLQVRIVEVQ